MRPWSQPIGFQHALFEVAIDVLKRAMAPEPKAILNSIIATNYNSIVGHVQMNRQAGEERHQDAAGRRPIGSAAATASSWSSPPTGPRRIFRSVASWNCCS